MTRKAPPHNSALRVAYAIALLGPIAVTVAKWPLRFNPLDPTPMAVYFIPIAVAAVMGGLWPGLLSSAVSLGLGLYYFVPVYRTFVIDDHRRFVQVISTMSIWLLISLLGEWKRRSSMVELAALEKLRINELQTTADYDRIADALITIDHEYAIVRANRAFLEIQPDNLAVIGKKLWDLSPFEGQDGANKVLIEATERREACQLDITSIETGKWFHVRSFPETVGTMLLLTNISERKRLEEHNEELLNNERSLRLKAERATRTNEEFLTILSHELRTPLSAIIGWTELLMGRPDLDPKVRSGLEQIERSGRDQSRLVEDLLDKTRISAGRVELERSFIDFKSLVVSGVDSMRPAAEEQGIKLTLLVPDESVVVFGDPIRLQQVLMNLLTNAIKFTPSGGHVDVSLMANANDAVLKIVDNGEGIESDLLPHIFDRFRQADQSITRRHGGIGLGLTIVRDFLRLHHGTVSAQSEGLGKGSQFTVILPRALVRASDVKAAIADDNSDFRLDGVRAMLVEDDDPMREVIAQMLVEAGANVVAFRSAIDALDALALDHPDVIVSDIGMPNMDGYTFIRSLRKSKDKEISGLPAVAVTAYASADDRTEALNAGFQRFVGKPVKSMELRRAVSQIVRH